MSGRPTKAAKAPSPRLTAADHWRLAYERTAAQLELALQLLQRAAGPAPHPRAPRAPEDVEASAVQRAEEKAIERARANERDFVERAAADLVQKGADPVHAKREAQALWQAATDFHPEGG
jgi:hypothetical protein